MMDEVDDEVDEGRVTEGGVKLLWEEPAEEDEEEEPIFPVVTIVSIFRSLALSTRFNLRTGLHEQGPPPPPPPRRSRLRATDAGPRWSLVAICTRSSAPAAAICADSSPARVRFPRCSPRSPARPMLRVRGAHGATPRHL